MVSKDLSVFEMPEWGELYFLARQDGEAGGFLATGDQ
jgi:hypothetical protein